MILVHYTQNGARRTTDMQGIYHGSTALLVGGAPSLKEQPLELLEERGVLTMAMNNAAVHFKPTLWASADNPACYDSQIVLDPGITKFANMAHANVKLKEGIKYSQAPGVYFYIPEKDVAWDEFFGSRPTLPWYNNTLFTGMHILYMLGIRRIILAGSDFGFSGSGEMYAHDTSNLGSLEQKWNLDLYNSQVRELRRMKPTFEQAGLEFMDCSKNSRIAQVYEHVSLEKAVELCREGFPPEPADTSTLPHCSKFASKSIQEQIAKWPGYKTISPIAPEKDTQDRTTMKKAV